MIVIPDIHGRNFWKEALTEKNDKLIFLGDYVDPYSEDKISGTQVIDNFQEILDLKKSEPDRVVLLLGDHDFMYMTGGEKTLIRHDYENEETLKKLFSDNKDLFQIVYAEDLGGPGNKHVFSHAGILPSWLKRHEDLFGTENPYARMNELYKSWDPEFISSLWEISPYRGGFYESGSIIWADLAEHMLEEPNKTIYQFFGHTKLNGNLPILEEHFAGVDCKEILKLED